MEVLNIKKEFEPFQVNVAEDLVVCISQYKSTEYTNNAIKVLRKSGIPFTSIVLCDGTDEKDISKEFEDNIDIKIHIKKRVNSLPHIWNIMHGVAKLTGAKYLYHQDSDIELKEDALKSMMSLINQYDIVSPVKIDKDREKFDAYTPLLSSPQQIVGFNDSCVLFNLDKLHFMPFDEHYAPYQWEITDLAYNLYKSGLTSVLETKAVAYHFCSKDIKFSPENRTFGSDTWDDKKEYFLNKDDDPERKLFVDKSVMNSQSANKYGFPCYEGCNL